MHKNLKRISLCALAILSFTGLPPHATAAEMSIAQAYKLQRHKQTTFNQSHSKISAPHAKYLDHLFFVTDLAFRERMLMLQYFHKGKNSSYIDEYNTQIGQALASFELIKAPDSRLKQVENVVVSAIKDQQRFFNIWHKSQGTSTYHAFQKNYTSHRDVQKAHQKLIQAYGMLKQSYPREISHNQQAFYDHLCALDFI